MRYLTIFSVLLFISFTSCNKKNDPDPDQVAYDNADLALGGKLYDKLYASETGFVSPSDASVNLDDIKLFGDFYRCKSCHGWDLRGNLESYINRGPTTTRPNVASSNLFMALPSMSIRQVFDAVKHANGAAIDPARTADGTNSSLGGDNMANYGKIFTDEQIWNLVKFLKEGVFDVDQLYDITVSGTYPTGSRTFSNIGKDGNATAGAAFYDSNCASCHGANGRDDGAGTIIAINANIGLSMGQFARSKPYELQHKARFGQLGSSPLMTGVSSATLTDIKDMLKALADTNNYPDL